MARALHPAFSTIFRVEASNNNILLYVLAFCLSSFFFYILYCCIGWQSGGGKDILSYRILSCCFFYYELDDGFIESGSLLIGKGCLDMSDGSEYGIWIWVVSILEYGMGWLGWLAFS